MLESMQNSFYRFSDWVEDTVEETGLKKFAEYCHDRALPYGAPVAVISSVAFAVLFGGVPLGTAAVFGLVNYTVVALTTELLSQKFNVEDKKLMALILLVDYAVSWAFVNNICGMPLTLTIALPLAGAAFLGHLSRVYFPCYDTNL